MGCCTSTQVKPADGQSEVSKVHRKPTSNREQHKRTDAFQSIDVHALKAPQNVKNSVASLAEYLVQGARTDKEKVRAFYVWIANNIRYDSHAFFSGNYGGVDADSVLRSGASVCSGYANLFEAFCKIAQIQVQVIHGFAKGYGHSPEKHFSPNTDANHAWNAIYLDNKWEFIESTWGAGHLSDSGEFQREFSNFHFLPNPIHFIVAHFPFDNSITDYSKKWQLLKTPMSLEDFNRNIKLTQSAMEWNIQPKSHRYGVVDVKGFVEIVIEDKKGQLCDTSFHFWEKQSGNRIEEYGFLRKESANEIKITLHPPKATMYSVRIFGRVDPSLEKLNDLMTYVINCAETRKTSPYPRLTNQWGIQPAAFDHGLLKWNQYKIPAILRSRNGRVELTLKTTRNIPTLLKLSHATNQFPNGERFTLVTGGKDFLDIKLRLPYAGYYKLGLMFKREKSSDDLYHGMANFLVECESAEEDCIPFPATHPQTQEYSCSLMEPFDGKLPANKSVKFKFKSSVVRKAIAGGEQMKQNGEEWSAEVRTPGAGRTVDIMGTNVDENRYWGLFTFDVI